MHTLTAFKYAHLMEKAKMMVVRNGINDTEKWDHMWEGQLVVLTSPLEPDTPSHNGRQ